ncbi:OmpA family protein [Fulvimarina sp. MAC8]|uniref:OmpA family protein n=1 Tax=Fulvimarina sp. MAC8 TaxID=3162874 RepID=UPI0032EDD9A7
MRNSILRITKAVVFLTCLVPAMAVSQESDIEGASDHPDVGRYEGAVIYHYQSREYDEVRLPTTSVKWADRENLDLWQAERSGKVTGIGYMGPAGRSLLEVMRNYESKLEADGFEIEFFCRGGGECGGNTALDFYNAGRGNVPIFDVRYTTVHYLLAEKDGPDGLVSVAITGIEREERETGQTVPQFAVRVVEGRPMEADKIEVFEASEIEQALEKDGKLAIYGIYFDTGKADLKPESEEQIAQLGAALTDNPDLDVIIVGHTDSEGSFEYNLTLSQNRAQAVVDAVVSGYQVSAERLTPAGAGMVSPVATNRTETGRARNRRVEVVENYRPE